MKIGQAKHNSLLTKYSLQYEKKPRSRVFAPLAESYRKIGMLDEALNILKKGIKNHPTYILGYIVLANCYFDKDQYEAAYSTLLPFVSGNQENIKLQKLFAQISEKLGNFDEALNSYKILLLINPKDVEIAKKVKQLEDDVEIPEKVVQKDFEEESNNLFDTDEDDWVQVDFNKSEVSQSPDESYDQWNVVKQPSVIDTLDKFKEDIQESRLEVKEHELDDQFFYETYDNHSEDTIDPVTDKMTEEYDNKPIITHTLVDLYCEQGHYDKAISILESIIELHPHDKPSILKLEHVQLLQKGEVVELKSTNIVVEEDSEIEISFTVDQKLKVEIEEKTPKNNELQQKLQLFLKEIKKTASLKQNETMQNSNY